MTDRLILKRTAADRAYATLYDHPVHGQIDVGRIFTTASLGNVNDPWHWCIRIGSLPGMRRQAEGTAYSKEDATEQWKANWSLSAMRAPRQNGSARLKAGIDRQSSCYDATI